MSAVEIKFIRPTIEAVEFIAANMRQADADEVWASDHHSPIDSMMKGWEASHRSTIATVNDEPCVMFGLVLRGILSGSGTPWLLGTDNAVKYKRHFLTKTPVVIDEMLNICPRLSNMVHAKNEVSIRWLNRLGFTIESPVEYGPDGELFHHFHLERVQ